MSENHEQCVQQLDVLRDVINQESVLHKLVFLDVKQRPWPVSCESHNDENDRVKTDQAAGKVVYYKNLLKVERKTEVRKKYLACACATKTMC